MKRAPCPSDCYQACKDRRIRRLKKVASPRLWEAFVGGQLSLRAAEIVSRKLGNHSAQNRWLCRELERRRRKIEGERTAAAVIMDFLGAGRIDLSQIGAAIREAIHVAL